MHTSCYLVQEYFHLCLKLPSRRCRPYTANPGLVLLLAMAMQRLHSHFAAVQRSTGWHQFPETSAATQPRLLQSGIHVSAHMHASTRCRTWISVQGAFTDTPAYHHS